jgi:hypothetical protein
MLSGQFNMCLHTRKYIVLYNIEKHVTAFEEQALCVLHPNMGQRRMKRRVARASTSKSQAWRKGRTVRYGEMRQDTRNDSQETRRGALRVPAIFLGEQNGPLYH